jgi:hypothetical protein
MPCQFEVRLKQQVARFDPSATSAEENPATLPKRIVCLTGETLCLLGEDQRFVGVSGYAVKPCTRSSLSDTATVPSRAGAALADGLSELCRLISETAFQAAGAFRTLPMAAVPPLSPRYDVMRSGRRDPLCTVQGC